MNAVGVLAYKGGCRVHLGRCLVRACSCDQRFTAQCSVQSLFGVWICGVYGRTVCVCVCRRVLAACVLKGYSVWLCVTVVQSLEM